MANAAHDENSRTTMTAINSTDGVTIERVMANKNNHGLKIVDGTTGTDQGNNGGIAAIDENSIPVYTAMASDGSGEIVELYVDNGSGALLIDSM